MRTVPESYSFSQSMIYSRYYQLGNPASFSLSALDLAVSFEQFAKANSLVNAPSGIPFSVDLHFVYTKITDHILKFLSQQSTKKNIHVHLKDLFINEIRGDQFLEIIPTQNKMDVALRFWVQPEDKDVPLISRVLLFLIRPVEVALQPIVFFSQQFGNIELCLLPSHLLRKSPILFATGDDIERYMLSSDFIKITHYLDHGQTLNLSELSARGFSDLSNHERLYAGNPYQQYLNDILYYKSIACNGTLITRHLPNTLRLLHLTPYKSAIIDSNELKVSRAGCIGNMIYTTSLVGDESEMLGGHTIGLCNRLGQEPANENLLLLEVEQKGNKLTNWIEKLGRGRLFLEARNWMLSSGTYKNYANKLQFMSSIPKDFKKKFFQLGILSEQAVEMYHQCSDLFYFCIYYGQIVKPNFLIYQKKIEHFFWQFSNLLKKTGTSDDNKPYYSVLNSIFFETIKDYILLFQSDLESQKYKKIHSFNMHIQYEIFFELFPQLKTEWNTHLFPTDILNVLKVLEKWGFFVRESSINIFMEFVLNRFAYYINVALLEGEMKIPSKKGVSFDFLSSQFPNLMGNLFNVIIAQYKSSNLFEQYMTHLRACYDLSYEARNIQVAVKSGLCGTDEIGIRPQSNIRFFNLDLVKRDTFFIAKATTSIELTIGGESERNGFTARSFNSAYLTIENLSKPSFDLRYVTQDILEQNYLKSFLPVDTIDRSQDLKHFEVKSSKIARVTHGAMHAARVMLYVKVLHFFRLQQQDACAIRFLDFAKSVDVNEVALLHLTQLAALFHDSARLDEGSDRWDKESSIKYFQFIQNAFPILQKKLIQLMANTIAFKDDENSFFSEGLLLGFTRLQMEQVNYLRQLVHDADCLDIMRVKSTFKTKFLEMKLYVNQDQLLELVKSALNLIKIQYDQYKDCKIIHHDLDLPINRAAFNIERKCKYEWSPDIISAIIVDMHQFPWLKTASYSWDFDILNGKELPSMTKSG